MNEAYFSIGDQADWFVPLLAIAIVLIDFYNCRQKKKWPPLWWAYVLVLSFGFSACLLTFPGNWFTAFIWFGLFVGILLGVRQTNLFKVRLVASLFPLMLGTLYATKRQPSIDITISDSKVTYYRNDRQITLPRSEIGVHSVPQSSLLTIRKSSTWWFGSTKKSELSSVMTINGSIVYRGPHGLISGDDLARQIVNWAHISPSFVRRSYLASHNK